MSIHISDKALQDLEFTTVIQQVAEFSISELGKRKVLETLPFSNKKQLLQELNFANEYISSFESDNRIPNHGFDNIYEQIKRLSIEDSYIEPESFLKIAAVTTSIKELKRYFNKFNALVKLCPILPCKPPILLLIFLNSGEALSTISP